LDQVIRVTMRQLTNAFYIQSPRLQNAVPIFVSEKLAMRIRLVLRWTPVHVDSGIPSRPDLGREDQTVLTRFACVEVANADSGIA